MDLRLLKKQYDLLSGLCIKGQTDVEQVPYLPQKTEYFDLGRDTSRYFPRAGCAEVGIDPRHVTDFLRQLELARRVNIHSLMIVADGRVICDAAAPGYRSRPWHLMHSMSKTVTGLAVGMLCDEGRLSPDDLLADIFRSRTELRIGGKFRRLRVRHLLDMSSGVSFSDFASVVAPDWLDAFFSSDFKFEPGEGFEYNSMNSYVLGMVVRQISGQSLSDYLRPRLFEPLHIRDFFWERNPQGYEKGGWGLYLRAEDLCKLGMLLLDRGVFEGKRVISERWISEMTAPHRVSDPDTGDYDYGYQMWVHRDGSSCLFNGMLGQNVWIHPKNRMVIVSCAGNPELFQRSAFHVLVERFFGGAYRRSPVTAPSGDRLPSKQARKQAALTQKQAAQTRRQTVQAQKQAAQAQRDCEEAQAHFYDSRTWARPLPPPRRFFGLLSSRKRPLPPEAAELIGRSYEAEPNNVGLLPFFVRMLQNNHSRGIRRVSFSGEGEHFFFCVEEGEDIHRMEVGFYTHAVTCLDFRGERYLVAVLGQFMENEDNLPLLKIDMVFPEMPNHRHIKLFYEATELRMALSEVPGREVVSRVLDSFTLPRVVGGLLSLGRIDINALKSRALGAFDPVLHLTREGVELLPPAADEAPLPEPSDRGDGDAAGGETPPTTPGAALPAPGGRESSDPSDASDEERLAALR